MANEAYRAVFLRVHPTGKMVLSLTTEADGKEPEYAQLVAAELGVPALDVKVVPATVTLVVLCRLGAELPQAPPRTASESPRWVSRNARYCAATCQVVISAVTLA